MNQGNREQAGVSVLLVGVCSVWLFWHPSFFLHHSDIRLEAVRIEGDYREPNILNQQLVMRIKVVSMLMSKIMTRASLVAQWLRICLPMQGTRVRALVWEDPTCHGATGPVSHNY